VDRTKLYRDAQPFISKFYLPFPLQKLTFVDETKILKFVSTFATLEIHVCRPNKTVKLVSYICAGKLVSHSEERIETDVL